LSLQPKVAEYIENAKNAVSIENLPGDISKIKTKNLTKTIVEEGLHGDIGNPEKLFINARKKADEYAHEAFSDAAKEGTILAKSPVQAGIDNVNKWLSEGNAPGGNTKLINNALKQVSEDMIQRGYGGDILSPEMAFNFKRDLSVDWKAGTSIKDSESAKNQVRKLMYYGADNLIDKPEIRKQLKKSADLYKLMDVLQGQKKAPITAMSAVKAASVAAPTALVGGAAPFSRVLGDIPPPILAGLGLFGAAGAGTYHGVKSGQLGKGLIMLSDFGGPVKIPKKSQNFPKFALDYKKNQQLKQMSPKKATKLYEIMSRDVNKELVLQKEKVLDMKANPKTYWDDYSKELKKLQKLEAEKDLIEYVKRAKEVSKSVGTDKKMIALDEFSKAPKVPVKKKNTRYMKTNESSWTDRVNPY